MTMNHRDGALAWWKAGMSVVPVVADGSKRPLGSWKDYQSERADAQRVDRWFKTAPEQGVGIICGKVSGGLEMLEIEAARMGSEHLDKVWNAMIEQGVGDLWVTLTENLGYCESTPSGGIHILYRIEDQDVPGNTKIALDPTGKITYAETRGEGGFVVVAPSGGTVHKSGESWSVLAGEIGMNVFSITWDERCKIHEALRVALDERVLPTYERPTSTQEYTGSGTRPGDAYNADPSVTVYDILTENGWKYLGKMAGQDRYVHPLSSDMTTHSACTGYKGSQNLYAWSGLPKEDFYDKFSLLAHLKFNGDFSAAGKYLAGLGYGDKPERLDISDWFKEDENVQAPAQPQVPKTAKKIFLSEWTESGVGELLAANFGDRFRHVSDQKLWRFYRNGLWAKDQGNEVETRAARITKMLLNQARDEVQAAKENDDDEALKIANGVIRKAESFRSDRGSKAVISRFAAQQGVRVPSSDFDGNVDLIRFENGTLDLSTFEFREHRPEDMITLDVPYCYDPQAQAPKFRKFMDEILPDKEIRGYMQRSQGYALAGRPNEGVWFALWGDTGCGKSTYLEILTKVLGDHARTAAQATFAQRNEGSRAANDLNDIRNARMVMVSETKEGQLFNESLIKQYSGGDTMNSHGLYQENGTWTNRGVLFMATNHPPRLSADDAANWRRIKMIEFPVSQYNHPDRTPDPHLGRKIVESELAGIMNWVIEGLKAYREFGLDEPKAVTSAVQMQRTDSDQVAQFLMDGAADGYITVEPELSISSTQLYRIFENWCRDNGLKALGNRRFGMSLTSKRYETARTSTSRSRLGIGIGSRGAFGTM